MNTIGNLLTNLRTLLCCVREISGYALIFLWAIFCPKAVLAAKLLAVESQLAVCKHQIGQRKRRRPRFWVQPKKMARRSRKNLLFESKPKNGF